MFSKKLASAIALAALTIGCSQAEDGNSGTNNANIEYAKGDVLLGNADADVQIIEYASTACGHCRTFHKTILPNLKRDFIDTGLVNMIYRDLPTPPAAVAAAGGAIARCAGEDDYFDVLDDVFTSQGEIFDAARQGAAITAYVELGARHGMDAETVRTCVTSSKVLDEIVRTSDLADKDGVTSTPTLFINGERVSGADMNLENLTALLNAKLGIEPTEESDTQSDESETIGSSEAAE